MPDVAPTAEKPGFGCMPEVAPTAEKPGFGCMPDVAAPDRAMAAAAAGESAGAPVAEATPAAG